MEFWTNIPRTIVPTNRFSGQDDRIVNLREVSPFTVSSAPVTIEFARESMNLRARDGYTGEDTAPIVNITSGEVKSGIDYLNRQTFRLSADAPNRARLLRPDEFCALTTTQENLREVLRGANIDPSGIKADEAALIDWFDDRYSAVCAAIGLRTGEAFSSLRHLLSNPNLLKTLKNPTNNHPFYAWTRYATPDGSGDVASLWSGGTRPNGSFPVEEGWAVNDVRSVTGNVRTLLQARDGQLMIAGACYTVQAHARELDPRNADVCGNPNYYHQTVGFFLAAG